MTTPSAWVARSQVTHILKRIAEEVDRIAVHAGVIACRKDADPDVADLCAELRALAAGIRKI